MRLTAGVLTELRAALALCTLLGATLIAGTRR